tara:strand:+ start:292 stop:657 length:366 start_codon:yes stop_codon:yes gene_type:complete
MKINDWANAWFKAFRVIQNPNTEHEYQRAPRNLICRDGFSFSIQAGPAHYSTPKKVADKYDAFEIGFPSASEPIWEQWREDVGNPPEESVYGWVPTTIINHVIKFHGGIDVEDFIIDKLRK